MKKLIVLVVLVIATLLPAPAGAARTRVRTAAPNLSCVVNGAAETRPWNLPYGRAVAIRSVDWDPNVSWPAWYIDDSSYRRAVDGNFRGSTDAIILWAACKWRLDPDVLRAVAAVESWWDATTLGDGGESKGLFQVKGSAVGHVGTFPAAWVSSAWNADYYAATLRACLDGHVAYWRDHASELRRPYTLNDVWGCVEVWYTGMGPTSWSEWYSARVQEYLAQRRWLAADFTAWQGWNAWCASVPTETAAGYVNCTTGLGS